MQQAAAENRAIFAADLGALGFAAGYDAEAAGRDRDRGAALDAVRASGAYPQTDAYKKAWEEAASNADEALRIRLGIEAYQKMGNGR